MVDIEETITGLANIATANKAVTGIVQAYTNNPVSLDATPAICYFVGPQVYTPFRDSETVKLESTTIFVRLHEAPITTGIPGEVEDRIKGRMPLIRDELLSHPKIGKLNGILRSVLISTTGIRPFAFAGLSYAGCEWKLTVERIIGVNYAAGE